MARRTVQMSYVYPAHRRCTLDIRDIRDMMPSDLILRHCVYEGVTARHDSLSSWRTQPGVLKVSRRLAVFRNIFFAPLLWLVGRRRAASRKPRTTIMKSAPVRRAPYRVRFRASRGKGPLPCRHCRTAQRRRPQVVRRKFDALALSTYCVKEILPSDRSVYMVGASKLD
jgi:hypothetical protein